MATFEGKCKLRGQVQLSDLIDMSHFVSFMEFSIQNLCSRLNYHELVNAVDYKFGGDDFVLIYFNTAYNTKSLLMYKIEQFFELFEDA